MKKIDKLTHEQESKLEEYKNLYINKFFNSKKDADFNEVQEYVNWLYNFSKLETPITILVNSPYEILIAYNYCKILLPLINRNQVRNQVENQVENQVWNQVRNQVENQVRNQVRNQVENQVGNQVWNQVWNQVRNQVENQVENQVGNQVWNQVRNQVENQKLEFLDISWYLSSFNSWLSFYNYFNDQVLKLDQNELLRKYSKVLDLNIFWGITLDGLCIVSKNAIDFQRNANFQLHSVDKSAMIFPGEDFQYKLYFIQGISISEELFTKLSNKEYTFEDWTKESNEEIKAVVLAFYEEKFGGEFVFRFLSKYLIEVDNYIDKKDPKYLEGTIGMNIGVYTLFKGIVNDIDIAYVRCYCPSTDRMFFLGVSPDIDNAKDAIASLCQIPVKLSKYLTSIARQGEMFSFNFNEIGTKMLKEQELTKDDYLNVVSLKGNEYFSKIKFEY